jgi:hypothetical protein
LTSGSDTIGITSIFAEEKSCVQGFAVIGERFMDPFICYVFAGNVITEPFMTTFMYNDKIPF